MKPLTVLVTGATGYVGRQLVPRLLDGGYVVRCFVRDPEKVQAEPWFDHVDVHQGDAHDYESVWSAMDAMDACYYLIHSFGAGEAYFAEYDRRAATNFGKAAREQGLGRLVYLGMARRAGRAQTDHVTSRIETGMHLRRWNVPVTEFRPSLLLGRGSPAFTLIQSLAEHLPLIPAPLWMQTSTRPISTQTVLDYLLEALEVEDSAGEIIDIGGPDPVSLADLIRRYAGLRALRRAVLPLPVAAPYFSAYVISILTPLSAQRALFLVQGLRSPSTIDDEKARGLFSIEPPSVDESLRRAMGQPDTVRLVSSKAAITIE